MKNEIVTLGTVADVKLGHPFRGTIPEMENGNLRVVRAKDINQFTQVDYSQLLRTFVQGRKEPDFLNTGDVLFLAKGKRNVSTYIDVPQFFCVCGPEFFLVRVKPECLNKITPEFLSMQINQLPAQKYFRQASAGSHQVSIKKQELDNLKLVIPSIDEQELLVTMWKAYLREQQVLQQLMNNRTSQILEINRKFLTE